MKIEIPEKLTPLFNSDKKRFAIWGGRGSGKSWASAYKVVISAYMGKRCLCVREVAANVDGSIKNLLVDSIERLGLNGFTITDKKITNVSGGTIEFKGVKGGSYAETRTKLKGLENYDVFWFEEAEGASGETLDLAVGTFERLPDIVEIYTYNRYFRKDPVHNLLVLSNDPTVERININYWDNPFIDQKMIDAADRMRETDINKYNWKYGGQPKTASNLRVFHQFKEENNSSPNHIPHKDHIETWTAWDFGISDPTAIAIVQITQHPDAPNGIWIDFIDEKIARNKGAKYYKEWILGHDNFSNQWRHAGDPAGTARSHDLTSWISELAPQIDMEYTYGKSISEFVDLANQYVPSVRINESQCPQFYDMFTNWEYPEGEDGLPKEGSKPKHDSYSHPGTAFYYLIMERFNPDNQRRKVQIL